MITVSSATLELWLGAFLLPFFRILGLMTTAPVFSHASVPAPLRVLLAVLLALIVAPVLPAPTGFAPFSPTGLVLIVAQVIVGIALGFAVQIAFAAVELAGDLIGLQMGLSFAMFVDPQNAQQTPIVGGFLSLVLMLVFLSINGHLLVLSALIDTFQAIPLTPEALRGLHFAMLASAGANLFSAGLSIALPVIAAMLLTNLALGVITRTAPQLNLFAIGFPVTLIVGLVMLWLGMPYLMPSFERVLTDSMSLLAR